MQNELFNPFNELYSPEHKRVIKFSHRYPKLLNFKGQYIDKARLLNVSIVNIAELNPEFLRYDTNNGQYKYPKSGTFILLLFFKLGEGVNGSTNLFTTLRTFEAVKYDFYSRNIGATFSVVFK